MRPKDDDLFTIGASVLATELADNGVITAQLGDVVSSSVVGAAINEVWGPYGYYSRPSKPDVGSAACQVIAITGGDRDIVIAARDLRQASVYGNLAEGEICLAAGGSDAQAMGKFVMKAEGSLTLATSDDNTKKGNIVYQRVGPDGWTFQSPWGSFRWDASGIIFTHVSGASLKLVATSNPLSPNAIMLKACQVFIDTARCTIMPTATNGGKGIGLPVVVAPVGSPQTGVPVPIGAGMGVIMGETGSTLVVGI
jgi:hypothetical protein